MDAFGNFHVDESSFSIHNDDSVLMETLCPELEVEEIDESILNDIDLNLECDDDGKSYSLPKPKVTPTTLICDISIEITPPEERTLKRKHSFGFQCYICKDSFSMESKYCRHMKDIHQVERPFQCKSCSYSSTCSKLMIKHSKRKHQFTDNVKIDFLKTDFSGIQTNQEDEEKSEKCNVRISSHDTALENEDNDVNEVKAGKNPYHVSKQNEQVFFCCRCPYQTTTKSLLNAHMIGKHTSDRKLYRCDTCDFTCKQRRTLDVHSRKHEGDSFYKCDICSKTFYSKTAIKRHTVTHNQDRPYACTYENCLQSFKFQGSLTDHVKKVHLRKSDRNCAKSSKNKEESVTQDNASEDVRKSSESNLCKLGEGNANLTVFKCTWKNCGKSFRDNYNLNTHMAVHTGKKKRQCPHCSFTCIQKHSMDWHLNKKHSDLPTKE